MIRSKYLLPLMALALMLLTACSQTNVVPLIYPSPDSRPPACSKSFTVGAITDARQRTDQIGTMSDGVPFRGDIPASEWTGWALFEELSARGCEARHRVKPVAGDDYNVVTGEIESLTLNQSNAANYTSEMTLNLHIDKLGKRIFSQRFTVRLEQTVFPGDEKPREMMTETLKEIMNDAVPVLMNAAE